ncbi:DNA methyltransferase 1-associated protein 1 [Daktulosphaira vitifoliae]|uniref:DNA methyltransferase 1-associated protein 1 n=1 Tax=Daktulosphaira vitifoliae TaxID=58002 RepID=UPI0021AAD940|nr:DNA methyltransferase 1-associated protein 1 [Daktulosphaira vitifoliae]
MSEDIRDILDIDRNAGPQVSKDDILGVQTKKKMSLPSATRQTRRPEGMAREVFALLYNDKKDIPPVIETETGPTYKLQKARLGMRRVRPWIWTPFVNPAREDKVAFYHWRRVADEGKEYPFAKFNKKIEILKYTETEYKENLQSESWSREETDRLFDMCQRFDLRFIVIQGRWNYGEYENTIKRTTEDLKDRYYSVCNTLTKIRGGNVNETKMYDADHETRRKQQLERLYNRTPKQIEEEQILIQEQRKIEARKRERDRKTQDLQKLISAVDKQNESRKSLKSDKKTPHHRKRLPVTVRPTRVDPNNFEATTIKFPDIKNSGVSTRSQRMKIPANVSQKKVKNVEQALQSLKIKLNPIPTEDICQNYNDLRNEIVLLNELKAACSSSEFELQTLKHQYETLNPEGILKISPELMQELASLSVDEDEIGVKSNENKKEEDQSMDLSNSISDPIPSSVLDII